MYKGFREVTQQNVADIYTGEFVPLINEYLIMGDEVFRFDGKVLLPLRYRKIKGFTPKNIHQKMLFDLLDNNDIPIKATVGIAGSGKTKAALQYGLLKLKAGEFSRLFIIKQPAPVGEEIGFLKGGKGDKVRNWMGSIYDNLDGGEQEVAYLGEQIEFDIVAHMQGRDITNAFIIVDEAQLLTDEQIKMLGSRVSEGSIMVFCGDYEQIFATNKRYKTNNGLKHMIENLSGHPLFGVVELQKSVRSKVAELFATKL